MRVLMIIVIALLILSCEKQPMIFEPDTKVSQSVPAGQIGPQIDTLFTSWREFDDDPDQWSINTLYANQLDNGYFGLPGGYQLPFSRDIHMGWLVPYRSITFSFEVITTGAYNQYDFDIGLTHEWAQTGMILYYKMIHLQPNDTVYISQTVSLDSLDAFWYPLYSRKDINWMGVRYMHSHRDRDHHQKYGLCISELLVTGERGLDTPGKGE
jgi:hypothetical protein